MSNPTVRRRRLGTELRKLREARALRLEDVAAVLDVAPSTLSRIETGGAPTRTSYLATMLDLYDVGDPGRRRALADLAREGQRKPWWSDHAACLPAGTGTYLDLEAAAVRACFYAAQVLPGLLQTPGYTTAACRASPPECTGSHLAAWLAVQARRQQDARRAGLLVRLLVEEAALLTPVGAATVMAGQLRHLLTAAGDPAVTIQVLPLSRARQVISPPFAALDFADPADPPAVCYGPVAGQVILTTRSNHVQAARTAFTALSRAALPAGASADLIRNLAGLSQPRRKGGPSG